MPYIKQDQREVVQREGLADLTTWLASVPVEDRKGFLAYALEYLTLYSFKQNYFGRSTGLDALRSAYNELEADLKKYESKKREENGDV